MENPINTNIPCKFKAHTKNLRVHQWEKESFWHSALESFVREWHYFLVRRAHRNRANFCERDRCILGDRRQTAVSTSDGANSVLRRQCWTLASISFCYFFLFIFYYSFCPSVIYFPLINSALYWILFFNNLKTEFRFQIVCLLTNSFWFLNLFVENNEIIYSDLIPDY